LVFPKRENNDAYLWAELWSNLDLNPNEKICVGSKVYYSEITNISSSCFQSHAGRVR
jgi:hypothetical protein